MRWKNIILISSIAWNASTAELLKLNKGFAIIFTPLTGGRQLYIEIPISTQSYRRCYSSFHHFLLDLSQQIPDFQCRIVFWKQFNSSFMDWLILMTIVAMRFYRMHWQAKRRQTLAGCDVTREKNMTVLNDGVVSEQDFFLAWC